MQNNDYKKTLKLIGLRIQFLRQQKDLTQEDLANAINKTVDTISNIERGVGFARLDTLMNIASTLEAELSDLFDFPILNKTSKKKAKQIKKISELLISENAETTNQCFKILETILHLKKKG